MKMAKRTTRPTEKYRAVFFFIALANLAYFTLVPSSKLLVTRLFSAFSTVPSSKLLPHSHNGAVRLDAVHVTVEPVEQESIHKSQGSEFKYVIMPIFSDYGYMLDKQLVYTGITRAKSSLVLLGDYKTFIKSTHIKSRIKRKTGLLDAFNNID